MHVSHLHHGSIEHRGSGILAAIACSQRQVYRSPKQSRQGYRSHGDFYKSSIKTIKSQLCYIFNNVLPTRKSNTIKTSQITTKGQITIPASLRKQLGLVRGDRVGFIVEDGKNSILPIHQDISAAFGIASSSNSASLEDMEQAIAQRGAELSGVRAMR